jgi:GDP-6-deoxy-D-talose 4-dehydrogenase
VAAKKILLTGANGFTGRHMSEAAIAAGHEVHALAANLTDVSAVSREVAEIAPDFVIHLAAISAVTHHDEFAFYQINTFGTQNLFEALTTLKRTPETVLLASSANVYGNCDASPITEREIPAPVNHYAFSKLAAEGVARMYSQRLPTKIIRPFNYTGVGHDDRFVIPKIVKAYRARDPFITLGNLVAEREYNDVRFVVDTYLQLLNGGSPGETYNLCSGITYSVQQILQVLSDLTGHYPDIEVNLSLLRFNELQRLCGSPDKLQTVSSPRVRNNLRELLSWMLESGVAESPPVTP